jgi:hypothetical protein
MMSINLLMPFKHGLFCSIGGEGLSRKDKWTAMLGDVSELRGAFSVDLLPIIPQLAEETFDALSQLSLTGVFQYSQIAVPSELKKEQQDFLIALCQFWTVGYELITVSNRKRRNYEYYE